MSNSWPEQRKGEENPHARFTQEQAEDMRTRHDLGGITVRQLAEETGVCRRTIQRILSGERYSDGIT